MTSVLFSARGELRAAAPLGAFPGLVRHRLQHQTVGPARRGTELRQRGGREGKVIVGYCDTFGQRSLTNTEHNDRLWYPIS